MSTLQIAMLQEYLFVISTCTSMKFEKVIQTFHTSTFTHEKSDYFWLYFQTNSYLSTY